MSRFQNLEGKFTDCKADLTPLTDRAYKLIDTVPKFTGECTAKELREFMETIERKALELCLSGVDITNLALRCMSDRAATWSYEFSTESPVWPTWKDFKTVLREHFDPPDAMYQNALELMHMKYEKDVYDYHKRFNSLLQVINESGKLPEDYTIALYRAGLPLDIRNALRRQKLQGLTLTEIQKLVKDIEEDKEDPAPADKATPCKFCTCPPKASEQTSQKKAKGNNSNHNRSFKSKPKSTSTTDNAQPVANVPKRPCKHCGEGHFDYNCPTLNKSKQPSGN